MKLLYVAGSYRSDLGMAGVKHNIDHAIRLAREAWKLDVAVICPHGNSYFMDGKDLSANVFLNGDLEILKRCDGILMMTGWESSEGAIGEQKQAIEDCLPDFYEGDVDWRTKVEAWGMEDEDA